MVAVEKIIEYMEMPMSLKRVGILTGGGGLLRPQCVEPGVHPGGDKHYFGQRADTELEIPASLLDDHTAYVSLVTLAKDARIETAVTATPRGPSSA